MNIKKEYKYIIYDELSGENKGIGLITFNRPKVLNALSRETLEELKEALEGLKNNAAVRVVVLTGAGEKAFVAGADISQFPSMTLEDARRFAEFGQSVFNLLEALGQPVIAAVNGYALGGGCELASACDFIYAAPHAKFGQPEVNLGIIPGYGGTQRLVRQLGKAMAKELIFTGRIISADEALSIGLVNRVSALDKLLPDVFETARMIISRSPSAIREAKKAIETGYNKELSLGLQIEIEAFAKTFGTEDQKEGARAFLEKREPKFKGR